jgi:hypothetical protein
MFGVFSGVFCGVVLLFVGVGGVVECAVVECFFVVWWGWSLEQNRLWNFSR